MSTESTTLLNELTHLRVVLERNNDVVHSAAARREDWLFLLHARSRIANIQEGAQSSLAATALAATMEEMRKVNADADLTTERLRQLEADTADRLREMAVHEPNIRSSVRNDCSFLSAEASAARDELSASRSELNTSKEEHFTDQLRSSEISTVQASPSVPIDSAGFASPTLLISKAIAALKLEWNDDSKCSKAELPGSDGNTTCSDCSEGICLFSNCSECSEEICLSARGEGSSEVAGTRSEGTTFLPVGCCVVDETAQVQKTHVPVLVEIVRRTVSPHRHCTPLLQRDVRHNGSVTARSHVTSTQRNVAGPPPPLPKAPLLARGNISPLRPSPLRPNSQASSGTPRSTQVLGGVPLTPRPQSPLRPNLQASSRMRSTQVLGGVPFTPRTQSPLRPNLHASSGTQLLEGVPGRCSPAQRRVDPSPAAQRVPPRPIRGGVSHANFSFMRNVTPCRKQAPPILCMRLNVVTIAAFVDECSGC